MLKNSVYFLVFIFTLSGCIPLQQRVGPNIDTPLEIELAQQLLKPGKNTIIVNSFMRQRGGGVVTCAGFTVNLIPATQLARDRMTAIYGSPTGGIARFPIILPISKDIDNYERLSIDKQCNSDGKVVFENVADGQFYITSLIKWQIEQFSVEGGAISKLIQVSGGQTLEVILTNVY
jgi:hypothetical protein